MKLNKNSLQVFDALPKGWEISPLGEVLPIVYGKGLTKGKRIETGQFPVYGSSGLVGCHDEALTKKPTLIIGRKGSVGEVYYSKTPCWPIDTVYFAEEHESIHLNYFEHLLRGINLSALDKSTAVPGLSRDDYNAVEVAIAPLNEQHRIVAKIEELFSELDKGVESLTTAREQLKVYRQALLKHVFEGKLTEQWRVEHADQLETADQLLTRIKKEREKRYQEQLAAWEKAVEEWQKKGEQEKRPVKPRKPVDMSVVAEGEIEKLPILPPGWIWLRLGDLSVEVFDGPFGSNLKSGDYVDSGVRVIRLENIGPLEFKNENESFITEEKYQTLKKHTVSAGDVIFSSFVADGNRVVVLPDNIDVAVNKADCFCVRSYGESVFNHYLATFLSTRNAYKQLENQIHGATRPRVNTTQLKNCLIPLAPSQEQRKVIDCLHEVFSVIDRLNNEIDEDLEKAVSFRQAILKKAFSGQLVPQDPNDEPASELLARIKAEREHAQLQEKKKPRKVKKGKEVITMADLMEIMKTANDWMSAQEAFHKCGIADGAETDVIEKIYEELRGYVKENKISVERRGEEDWLRLAQGA
ncbi:MAG: restriction endonuclease subunit S [Desulfobulbaceae bacterium]|nr:restriction endonuclease subunit S [Desulfobulbaceae bacterium]